MWHETLLNVVAEGRLDVSFWKKGAPVICFYVKGASWCWQCQVVAESVFLVSAPGAWVNVFGRIGILAKVQVLVSLWCRCCPALDHTRLAVRVSSASRHNKAHPLNLLYVCACDLALTFILHVHMANDVQCFKGQPSFQRPPVFRMRQGQEHTQSTQKVVVWNGP